MPLSNPKADTSPARLDPALPLSQRQSSDSPARALRVAVVSEYYYPHLGGVCEHVHYFAREARLRGHHVDIVTSRMRGVPERPGIVRIGRSQPVYLNGSQGRISLGIGLRRQMRALLRDGGYDLVHVHSPLHPVLPLLAVEESEVPVVGTFHTYFDRSLGYRLGRSYFQGVIDSMQAVIAVSRSTIGALERYFHGDWRIIPNGIDTDVFHPGAPPPPELSRDLPNILFLGRFDPRNGLSTLIDAFSIINRRRPRARLVVVGDGPLRRYYHKRARGIPGIVFVGPVLDGRPSYYAHSAVYACPTTKASFGITLLEAMACETPIVCSDIVGFRDVVANGREALMVKCGDPHALADAIVQILEDDGLAAELGTTGRTNSMAYSWDRVTDRVLEVYREVLTDSPTRASA